MLEMFFETQCIFTITSHEIKQEAMWLVVCMLFVKTRFSELQSVTCHT